MYFIYKVICKCRSGFWLWRGGHVDLTLRASMEPAASPGARSWSLNTFLMSRRIHHSLPLTGCLLLLYLLFLIFILLTWLHWVLVVACGILVLGARSLSHWTTGEVPVSSFLMKDFTHPCQGTRVFWDILSCTPGWGHANVSNTHAEIFQPWKFKHECFMGIL